MFQTDWLSVAVTPQPFEYNAHKDITQRSWYIYNNEVKRIKELKIQKNKKKLRRLELRTFWL